MHVTSANAAAFYVDRHIAEGRAEQPALRTSHTTWSYGELLEQVERTGAMLQAAGVRPGDRVVIVLPDTPTAAAMLLAAMRIGAIPAPIHTRLSDEDYAFVCNDARPRIVVAGGEHVARMLNVRTSSGWPQTVVAIGEDHGAQADASAHVIQAEPAIAAAERADPVPTTPDDVALLQYTSGSTGRPKAVVHLHQGLLALPDGFGRRLALTDTDLCFSAAKLSFGYGLGNSLLFPLAAGASALLRAEQSEPIAILETIATARPSVFFGGPALYAAMLAVHDPQDPFDTTSVRLYVSAGEALPPALFDRWRTSFGQPILDGLGSTECLHVFACGEPPDLRPGSLGTAVPPYEVELRDEHGAPTRPGEPGHVHVKGPANGARYWDRPETTRKAMVEDGWIRTGDLMTQAPDGTFHYVGRSDDVFKVRGMKVAPLEVEARLNAHPAVAECVLLPVQDRSGTTIACAFVRLHEEWEPTSELARGLRTHAREGLSPHKVPRRVRFVEQLPRTGTGKLSRRDVVATTIDHDRRRGTMPVESEPHREGAPAPLEARGLSRRFRQGETEIRAVDGVDLTVEKGELVAVMGPSGSGKSTLLHLLGGIDRPDAGEVLIEGRGIAALSPSELALVRRRRLGFLLQFFSLLPTLTAQENVAFPLLLDGARDASQRAQRALARVGMEARAAHRPAELSGGEQQRVALARALVVEPALVLADEPTGNLDSATGREILTLLRRAADDGQSVVVVTHDALAAEQADRIVQMADGHLSELDSEADAPAAPRRA